MNAKCLIFVCYFFFRLSISWGAPHVVYLYVGPGANSDCVNDIEEAFTRYVKTPLEIHKFSEFNSFFQDLAWREDPSLLIMPGGNSSKYEFSFAQLPLESRQFIKDKIMSGSLSYLGICAGVFFAAEEYSGHYAGDTGPQEFRSINHGRKRLAIFPHVISPDPKTNAWGHAKTVSIEFDSHRQGKALWLGGPTLKSPSDIEILAEYKENCVVPVAPAVFMLSFSSPDGKRHSQAVASGVHFELAPVSSDSYYDDCLSTHDALRKIIFQKLGFSCED